MKGKVVSETRITMTELVMPNDTNPLGNLMGGNLLKWMDIAAGIVASKHAATAVVTAAVDNVSFKHPIRLGDVVTIEASVSRAFNTSMEVYMEVFAENPAQGLEKQRSNDAFYTMVSLDARGGTSKVCPLLPETEKEKKLFDGAQRRRELRLILGGRMKASDAGELKKLFIEE